MRRLLTRAHWRRAIHAIVAGTELAHLHPRANHAGIAELFAQHQAWFSDANVVGIGVGRKVKAGQPGGQALQVFVRKKLARDALADGILIPPELDGRAVGYAGMLATDVCGVGQPRRQSFIVFARPALPGYNVGDAAGASGTIGCVVRDRATGERLGLSCAHVLASVDRTPGASIFAPCLAEAQAAGVLGQAQIGTLSRVAPIGFSAADCATNVDAATFAPDNAANLSPAIALLGQPVGVRPSVSEGLNVRKVGAISGDTRGIVKCVLTTVKMDVLDAQGTWRQALFSDQIGISRFTDDGDSGALVLDEWNQAVGLHFWVADSLSVCQPIQRVLDALGCDLA